MKKYPYTETLPVFNFGYAACFTLNQLQMIDETARELIPSGAVACVRTLTNGAAVLCMDTAQVESPADLINTLAHEATHIWQQMKEVIGEECPGIETEAYHIGHITQKSYEWYQAHMKKTNKKAKKTK
jgi:hypothetical protein